MKKKLEFKTNNFYFITKNREFYREQKVIDDKQQQDAFVSFFQ